MNSASPLKIIPKSVYLLRKCQKTRRGRRQPLFFKLPQIWAKIKGDLGEFDRDFRACAGSQFSPLLVIYSAPKIESDIIHRSITRVGRAINILAHTMPVHAEGLHCLLELSQLTSSNAAPPLPSPNNAPPCCCWFLRRERSRFLGELSLARRFVCQEGKLEGFLSK